MESGERERERETVERVCGEAEEVQKESERERERERKTEEGEKEKQSSGCKQGREEPRIKKKDYLVGVESVGVWEWSTKISHDGGMEIARR